MVLKSKLICFFTVIFVLLSAVTISASAIELKNYNINFDLPKEFTVITHNNIKENSEFLKEINFTENSFKDYISANNIVLFASTQDKSFQIVVNAVETEFSKQTENLSYLDDNYIARLIPKLVTGDVPVTQIKQINENKYVMASKQSSDKAGSYRYTQYLTIKNKLLYNITFSYTESSQANLQKTEELINNLFIDKESEKITINKIENFAIYVVLILIILFFVVIAVYISYTFINDALKNRNTSDVAPYVKIKRRRFK